MSTPSNSEWKNPSDVMKQQGLAKLRKIRSNSKIDMTRRHSFNGISQDRENSPVLTQQQQSFYDTVPPSRFGGSQKRRNPFSCDNLSSQSKRRFMLDCSDGAGSVSTSVCGETFPSNLLSDSGTAQEIVGVEANSVTSSKHNRLIHVLNKQGQETTDISQIGNEEIQLEAARQVPDVLKEKMVEQNKEAQNIKVCSSPPLDWSLKSKIRILVHSSESCLKRFPGVDAKNVDSFVHHKLGSTEDWKDLDVLQQIRRCCMHYSYPHLPWISTFPRLSADFKSRLPPVIANSREIVESLQRDWTSTFTSVYQQLRGGLCPYFYVCTHQFTVMFRCLRSSTSTSWSALLSPSTRGLREMLSKEGIDYRMPNIRTGRCGSTQEEKVDGTHRDSDRSKPSLPCQPAHKVNSTNRSQREGNLSDVAEQNDELSDDENDIDDDDDDQACVWLEGMGLDKKDFPSLEPMKVKLQREGFRELDNRPQSLVYIEGVDVHSFFNFLLNYPACIASSGPQHGIPPTILSPVSFVGGRLVQNVVKHTTLSSGPPCVGSQPDSQASKATHVFEVSGPLLPHHVLNISSILQNSQECQSACVSCVTHSPSAAFNTRCENDAEKDKLASGLCKLFVEFSQVNHGLLQGMKDQLLTAPVLGAATAIRELHVTKSGYSWTC